MVSSMFMLWCFLNCEWHHHRPAVSNMGGMSLLPSAPCWSASFIFDSIDFHPICPLSHRLLCLRRCRDALLRSMMMPCWTLYGLLTLEELCYGDLEGCQGGSRADEDLDSNCNLEFVVPISKPESLAAEHLRARLTESWISTDRSFQLQPSQF